MSSRARLALCAVVPLFSTGCLLNPIGEDPGFEESNSLDQTPAMAGELFPSGSAAAPTSSMGVPVSPGPDIPIDQPAIGPSNGQPIPPAATGTFAPEPTPAPGPTPPPLPTPMPTIVVPDPATEPSGGDAGPDAGVGPIEAPAPVLPSDAGAEPVLLLDAATDSR